MIGLETNISAFLVELERLADEMPEHQEQALTRLAVVVQQDVEKEIQAGTYDNAIPSYGAYYGTNHRTSTDLSKPAWTRKANNGGLIVSVMIESAPLMRRIYIGGEAAKYAERLGELPDGRDGVNRSNPFMERASTKHAEQWLQIYEQDIFNAMGL